jgi:hypothetical protein
MTDIPEGQGPLPAGALDRVSPTQQHRDSNPGSAVPGRVVHCKREVFDVYIGRPSILGNPYRVLGEDFRDRAIRRFEEYARARISTDEAWREAVKGLHGKVLGCWCAPKACHGDVLLKLAAELNNAASTRTKA